MKCEWETIAFGDLLEEPVRNGLTKPKAIRGTGVKMIAMGEIFAYSRIADVVTDRVPVTEKELQNCSIKPLDILFARQSLTLEGAGKCSIITNVLEDTVFESHLIRTRVNQRKADPFFLYYYFNSPHGKENIKSIVEQVAAAGIRGSDLVKLSVPYPCLEKQRKISAILRSLDDKIELNNKINENLQQQLRTIFKARFTDNPTLENMMQIPLSELCRVITKGTTPTTLGKPFVKSGINFIKAESILDNHSIDKSKFAFIDHDTNTLLKRSAIQAGDIVFTIAGTLGRFALIDENVLPANTNQAVAIIRVDAEKVLPEYVYTCLLGEWHIDYYSKRVQQAVQANLSLTTIKSLPVPVLNREEMNKYVRLILPIVRVIKKNEMQNERLSVLRNTLLPKLMSGEIDVEGVNI